MSDTASLVVRVTSKGVSDLDKELASLSQNAARSDASVSGLIDKLKLQTVTAGKSKSAINLYEAAMKGATKAELDQIKALNKGIDRQDFYNKVSLNGVSALKAVSAAALAAGAAISTMIISSANSERELANLSTTAKTTKKDFAALSFVFKQYNVDAKGTADAMNDVSERLGEFAAAGSGPFQDFADVMGLTKTEAVAMANELQRLKPEEAIQRMVTAMEGANTQGAQMSFVLKSMSNDLEYASGAFADNGKVLNELKNNYSSFNDQLALTEGQAAQLQAAALSFDTLTSAFGSASKAISATLAPTMSGFFNSIIEVVPNATNTIIDFINTFNKAADIQSIAQLDAQMASLADTIENGVAKGYDKMSRNMQENPLDFVRVGQYQDAVQRLSELEQQKIKITEAQTKAELELAAARKGGQIGGGIGKAATASDDAAAQKLEAQKASAESYLESLRQANLTELQLIDAQEAEKLAKVAGLREQSLISEQAYQDALTEIQTNAVLSRAEIANAVLDEEGAKRDEARNDSLKKQAAEEAAKDKMMADGIEGQRNLTADLGAALGKQNALYKASAITTTTINTYKAAQSAFTFGSEIGGPILGGVFAAAAVAAGLANVAKISGAREQGGSMTAGSAYQMAERGKAEVIVPSGSSRARTAAQMKDIMGQSGGSGIQAVTIVNNTSGKIDSATTETDSEGQLIITINEVVASAILTQDSQIAKAIKNTRGQAGY